MQNAELFGRAGACSRRKEGCLFRRGMLTSVILSEGGEAAEVEPVGRLGRGGILGGGNVASNGREDFVCHP